MTGIELIKIIANIHNSLVEITVKGNDAIYMGDALRNLRALVQELQQNGISSDKQEAPGTEV